jgi:hypothetical protein
MSTRAHRGVRRMALERHVPWRSHAIVVLAVCASCSAPCREDSAGGAILATGDPTVVPFAGQRDDLALGSGWPSADAFLSGEGSGGLPRDPNDPAIASVGERFSSRNWRRLERRLRAVVGQGDSATHP